MRKSIPRGGDLPEIECACATVRRVSRLLTQLYDEELRPELQASQFALLSVLERRPGCNQSMIARALAFDKTTVSRNLSLMERKGWIEYVEAGDLRERGFHLTTAGEQLLLAARPGWRRAQNRLQSAMSSEQWDAMWNVFRNVTNAANRARKPVGDKS
jgi:DNA-binding MarR family transcriptional regulator